MTEQLAFPQIITERLQLTAPTQRHAAAMAVYLNDPDVSHMTGRIPHPYREADANAYIADAASSFPQNGCAFHVVDLQDNLIGGLGFTRDEDRSVEVGYWIGRMHWGQGFASEALHAAMRWAEGEWKRRWVRAGHFTENPASGQVLTKCGFLYTGVRIMTESRARGAAFESREMVWLAG